MTDYPYGRSGEAVCYYEDEVTEDELTASGQTGDNEVVVDGDVAYLYEAPAADDPGRGHYSEWRRTESSLFEQVDAISGDDGMCYNRFQSAV